MVSGHEIAGFDAIMVAQHLGAAILADLASSEQIAELTSCPQRTAARLLADLPAAERARRVST